MNTENRTRLREFFTEEAITTLFEALNNFELEITGKQMDWSDDIMYRHSLHNMGAYCSEKEKEFLERLIAKLELERAA